METGTITIAVVIWFVVAAVAVCVLAIRADDERTFLFGAFVAILWPAWLAIAVVLLPLTLGTVLRHVVRRRKLG